MCTRKKDVEKLSCGFEVYKRQYNRKELRTKQQQDFSICATFLFGLITFVLINAKNMLISLILFVSLIPIYYLCIYVKR